MMVMIVDDDPDDLELYRDLLSEIDSSITTRTFVNSVDALSELQLHLHPDLVILDLNMPKMSGLEFLRHVRSDLTLKDIRMAVITTSCSNEDVQAVRALKSPCLRKQSGFNDFKSLLVRLLDEVPLTH
jgi:CheY-like chemotaxis protein